MTLDTFTVKQFGEKRWQNRMRFPVGKLLAIEALGRRFGGRTSGIQTAFEYWRDKRRDGSVPLEAFELEPGGDVATTLIDVAPANPLHYRFTSTHFRYFYWMSDKRLAEVPHREFVNACSVEYTDCKAAGEPMAHHISHDLVGFRRNYLRLLLPLTDRSGQVTALACVSRHLESPVPGGSSPATPRG